MSIGGGFDSGFDDDSGSGDAWSSQIEGEFQNTTVRIDMFLTNDGQFGYTVEVPNGFPGPTEGPAPADAVDDPWVFGIVLSEQFDGISNQIDNQVNSLIEDQLGIPQPVLEQVFNNTMPDVIQQIGSIGTISLARGDPGPKTAQVNLPSLPSIPVYGDLVTVSDIVSVTPLVSVNAEENPSIGTGFGDLGGFSAPSPISGDSGTAGRIALPLDEFTETEDLAERDCGEIFSRTADQIDNAVSLANEVHSNVTRASLAIQRFTDNKIEQVRNANALRGIDTEINIGGQEVQDQIDTTTQAGGVETGIVEVDSGASVGGTVDIQQIDLDDFEADLEEVRNLRSNIEGEIQQVGVPDCSDEFQSALSGLQVRIDAINSNISEIDLAQQEIDSQLGRFFNVDCIGEYPTISDSISELEENLSSFGENLTSVEDLGTSELAEITSGGGTTQAGLSGGSAGRFGSTTSNVSDSLPSVSDLRSRLNELQESREGVLSSVESGTVPSGDRPGQMEELPGSCVEEFTNTVGNNGEIAQRISTLEQRLTQLEDRPGVKCVRNNTDLYNTVSSLEDTAENISEEFNTLIENRSVEDLSPENIITRAQDALDDVETVRGRVESSNLEPQCTGFFTNKLDEVEAQVNGVVEEARPRTGESQCIENNQQVDSQLREARSSFESAQEALRNARSQQFDNSQQLRSRLRSIRNDLQSGISRKESAQSELPTLSQECRDVFQPRIDSLDQLQQQIESGLEGIDVQTPCSETFPQLTSALADLESTVGTPDSGLGDIEGQSVNAKASNLSRRANQLVTAVTSGGTDLFEGSEVTSNNITTLQSQFSALNAVVNEASTTHSNIDSFIREGIVATDDGDSISDLGGGNSDFSADEQNTCLRRYQVRSNQAGSTLETASQALGTAEERINRAASEFGNIQEQLPETFDECRSNAPSSISNAVGSIIQDEQDARDRLFRGDSITWLGNRIQEAESVKQLIQQSQSVGPNCTTILRDRLDTSIGTFESIQQNIQEAQVPCSEVFPQLNSEIDGIRSSIEGPIDQLGAIEGNTLQAKAARLSTQAREALNAATQGGADTFNGEQVTSETVSELESKISEMNTVLGDIGTRVSNVNTHVEQALIGAENGNRVPDLNGGVSDVPAETQANCLQRFQVTTESFRRSVDNAQQSVNTAEERLGRISDIIQDRQDDGDTQPPGDNIPDTVEECRSEASNRISNQVEGVLEDEERVRNDDVPSDTETWLRNRIKETNQVIGTVNRTSSVDSKCRGILTGRLQESKKVFERGLERSFQERGCPPTLQNRVDQLAQEVQDLERPVSTDLATNLLREATAIIEEIGNREDVSDQCETDLVQTITNVQQLLRDKTVGSIVGGGTDGEGSGESTVRIGSIEGDGESGESAARRDFLNTLRDQLGAADIANLEGVEDLP